MPLFNGIANATCIVPLMLNVAFLVYGNFIFLVLKDKDL
jgi:hypothetical protein